jgi:hypothetical protein
MKSLSLLAALVASGVAGYVLGLGVNARELARARRQAELLDECGRALRAEDFACRALLGVEVGK